MHIQSTNDQPMCPFIGRLYVHPLIPILHFCKIRTYICRRKLVNSFFGPVLQKCTLYLVLCWGKSGKMFIVLIGVVLFCVCLWSQKAKNNSSDGHSWDTKVQAKKLLLWKEQKQWITRRQTLVNEHGKDKDYQNCYKSKTPLLMWLVQPQKAFSRPLSGVCRKIFKRVYLF